MSILMAKVNKYGAIGRITIRNQLAYLSDFIIRSAFLLLILYIFMQLWRVTYAGEGTNLIAGYSYEQMIWYLIIAESVILSSPKLIAKVETEVKNGDVGYQLIRPVNYVFLHYSSFLGEAAVRLCVNLLIGCFLGIALFGWSAPSGWHLAAMGIILFGSFTVQFAMTMMIALCAFWVEETRGLDFVYQKLLFTIGGMLLPLEMFPGILHSVSQYLPFQTVAYFSAKTAVQFDPSKWLRMLGIQWTWIVGLMIGVFAVYRKGVKKLNVNGG